MKSIKAASKAKFKRNTAAEDARIKAGIKADPDTRELTAKDFAEAVPFAEMMKRRRGRPKAERHKVPVTVRLEPDVVEFFRRSGPGWQTRMNDTLARYVARQRQGR
ncbi:MAG: BrnA antitoxin family protein [Steroidobacteraceae bacterium]